MPEQPILALRDVAVCHGSGDGVVHAIRHASAHFAAGQFCLIRGPAGSGKTTLISVLGLLLMPDRGEVSLEGRAMAHRSHAERAQARRDSIGIVFQRFRLFRSLSAVENIRIADRSGRMDPADLLRTMGLEDKAHRRPGEMNSGERQRVALARALTNDPRIVLADEPTAALDWNSGKHVAEILRELCDRDGRLVIAASRDTRLAPYADRVLTLSQGLLEERLAPPLTHFP